MNYAVLKEFRGNFLDQLSFAERPNYPKFIPAKVWVGLDRYKDKILSGLWSYVKKWDVNVDLTFLPNKSKSDFIISGLYDEDEDKILVGIQYKSCAVLQDMSDASWDRFKFELIQIIMHETIHRLQYQWRDGDDSNKHYSYSESTSKKTEANRRYLSNQDEVAAWAHCCYLEYRASGQTLSEFLQTANRKKFTTLTQFRAGFDWKLNEAVKALITYICRWSTFYEDTA